jgi:uncharacterized protein (TIGR03435 family)
VSITRKTAKTTKAPIFVVHVFAMAAVLASFAPDIREASPLHAQDADSPVFEVASVKRNKSGDGRVTMGFQPGGRYTAINIAPRMLVLQAYQIQPFQLLGAPDWLTSDRFDIIAKAEGNIAPGPNGPLPLMVRALLADRFRLVVHHEVRELPIYALVKTRSDGRLGPQLNPAAVDCAAARGGPSPPGGPAGPGGPDAPGGRFGRGPDGPALGPGGRPLCGQMIGPANIAAGGVSMAQVATLLAGRVNRVVVDRTGITGTFDLDLNWTPDQMPQPPPGALPPGAPALPPIDPNGPSIFTAVQEQLGLKLESTEGPVDVLVIDRVEPPTED